MFSVYSERRSITRIKHLLWSASAPVQADSSSQLFFWSSEGRSFNKLWAQRRPAEQLTTNRRTRQSLSINCPQNGTPCNPLKPIYPDMQSPALHEHRTHGEVIKDFPNFGGLNWFLGSIPGPGCQSLLPVEKGAQWGISASSRIFFFCSLWNNCVAAASRRWNRRTDGAILFSFSTADIHFLPSK